MNTDSSAPGPQIYPVTDLDPTTVTEVANRVARATSFGDLVYRESEVDALWSLVDIRLRDAELAASPDAERWRLVRSRLWEAHDLIPEGRAVESAAILQAVAELL